MTLGGLKLLIALRGRLDLTFEDKPIRQLPPPTSVLLFYNFLLNLEQYPYKGAGNPSASIVGKEKRIGRRLGAFLISFKTDCGCSLSNRFYPRVISNFPQQEISEGTFGWQWVLAKV